MPKLRNQGEYGKPTYTQAAKIIARFGGEAKLARLIGISRISVYRWNYRRPVGADGLIPTANIERIKSVARLEGILLSDEDWVPEVAKYDDQDQMTTKRLRSPRSVADLLS